MKVSGEGTSGQRDRQVQVSYGGSRVWGAGGLNQECDFSTATQGAKGRMAAEDGQREAAGHAARGLAMLYPG